MDQALSDNKLPDAPIIGSVNDPSRTQGLHPTAAIPMRFPSPSPRDGFLSPLSANQPTARLFLDMAAHVYPSNSNKTASCDTLLETH